MGFDKGKILEPCDFKSKCEAYDEFSFTCSRSKRDCNTWMLFSTGKITEFKIRF